MGSIFLLRSTKMKRNFNENEQFISNPRLGRHHRLFPIAFRYRRLGDYAKAKNLRRLFFGRS